jgi:coenzyme PQQ precursor peptide PqqA
VSPGAGIAEYGHGRQTRQQTQAKEFVMKWETPQAIDFRFGMEITMYIANR